MHCPNCGNIIKKVNQKFCTNCGYHLKQGGSFFDNEEEKWDYIRAWLYTIATILMSVTFIKLFC